MAEPAFKPRSEARAVEMFPGVTRRTLASGDRLTLCEITLDEGAAVPIHTHEHEQSGYVARGRLRFTVGDEDWELAAGDGYLVPGNVPHGGTVLEPSVLVDSFSPPREEYLDR
jgi:quercetin dioxygenase-like cupin family protein